MATTNPTVIGTPISNPNDESPAKIQRKLIPLVFNLPDNIVTTSPVEDHITVTIDSIDVATTSENGSVEASQDYIVVVKIVQTLSYCTRSLVGYKECTRTKTSYETFILPKTTDIPNITASYDYDVYVTHCNYIVPNIAKSRIHTIVVSLINENAEQPAN